MNLPGVVVDGEVIVGHVVVGHAGEVDVILGAEQHSSTNCILIHK